MLRAPHVHGLVRLERFEEAKSLLRRTIPVARRVLGEGHRLTLKLRWSYANALITDLREALDRDPDATLDDLREAVATLEDTGRTARRVFGGSHPTTSGIEGALQDAREVFRACETPSSPSGSA